MRQLSYFLHRAGKFWDHVWIMLYMSLPLGIIIVTISVIDKPMTYHQCHRQNNFKDMISKFRFSLSVLTCNNCNNVHSNVSPTRAKIRNELWFKRYLQIYKKSGSCKHSINFTEIKTKKDT